MTIFVIRISGMINIPKEVSETLFRLKLRRKYSAVILEDNSENKKLLRKLRDYVAYGTISKEMLEKLIKVRGQSKEEINVKRVAEEIANKNTGNLEIKPFFRLHPPRGGIESKKHFGVGKGVLGDNKDKINLLLERML
jgi:large subunit ribosomal protein L30